MDSGIIFDQFQSSTGSIAFDYVPKLIVTFYYITLLLKYHNELIQVFLSSYYQLSQSINQVIMYDCLVDLLVLIYSYRSANYYRLYDQVITRNVVCFYLSSPVLV